MKKKINSGGDIGWEEKPVDTARRKRSITVLKEKGIPFLPQLYVIVPESEAKLRTIEEIACRLLAMFGVCVYSEVRGSGESWEGAQKYLNKIDDILCDRLNETLTPEEKRYLAEKDPSPNDIAKFAWRYECCHVLMWALGFIDKLGFPGGVCDVSRMGKTIWQLDSLDSFLKNAKLQGQEEILDNADLILRYDWACVDSRINGRESPAGLNSGVVYEWHYAFEWLVGSDDRADWDDVTVST